MDAALAIFVLSAFIGGIVIGVVVVVSVASRREDRRLSLTGEAPDAMCRGARRLTGVWTRGSWTGRIGAIRWEPPRPDERDDGEDNAPPRWPGVGSAD